jgi:hypothetical protein
MPESVLGLRAEGLDPDDPAVIAAIDLVRWELSLLLESPHRGSTVQNPTPWGPGDYLPAVGAGNFVLQRGPDGDREENEAEYHLGRNDQACVRASRMHVT